MESITLPRILFQNKNLAKEFNQKRYLNTVRKWARYSPDDPRISIEVLADASYSSWSSAIKTNDNIFEPSLYLSPRDRQAISEDLGKESHEILRESSQQNNGSVNNFTTEHSNHATIALTKKYLKEGFKLISNGQTDIARMAISFKHRHGFRQNIQNQKKRDCLRKRINCLLTLYKP